MVIWATLCLQWFRFPTKQLAGCCSLIATQAGSVLCKKDCKEKWCSHATYTHCFGQTIIPIKLITVSFLSHNVLAKSLPPLNKTQCLWMLGHNISLRPKWDCIILCNLPFHCVFPCTHFPFWWQWGCPSTSQSGRIELSFFYFYFLSYLYTVRMRASSLVQTCLFCQTKTGTFDWTF